jgi:hypothetical protein
MGLPHKTKNYANKYFQTLHFCEIPGKPQNQPFLSTKKKEIVSGQRTRTHPMFIVSLFSMSMEVHQRRVLNGLSTNALRNGTHFVEVALVHNSLN